MRNLPLEPGERIIATYHKHWIIYVIDATILLVLLVIPKLGYSLLTSQSSGELGVDPNLAVFFYFAWFTLLWGYFFIVWTNTYLDAWIVTDRRIIDIEQESLFHRSVSDFRIEKIQNITVREQGIVANMFGYGTLHVETAGEKVDLRFTHIPRPYKVRDLITECHDKCLARLESSTNPAIKDIITGD